MGPLSGQVCRRSSSGIVLAVRLTPKSSKDEVFGVGSGEGHGFLKARVRAVPGKGEANEAIEKLIAKWLRVPRSKVGLVSGGKSRLKSIAVNGDTQELLGLLEQRLAELS